MGWASASGLFNTVASALIQAKAPDDLLTSTCRQLIDELRGGDWDTMDESLEQFESYPVLVRLFAEYGVYPRHRTMPRMDEERFDELERLWLGTTSGVWSVERGCHIYFAEKEGVEPGYEGMLDGFDEDVPKLLVATLNHMGGLFQEIRRLKARLRQEHGDRDDD